MRPTYVYVVPGSSQGNIDIKLEDSIPEGSLNRIRKSSLSILEFRRKPVSH